MLKKAQQMITFIYSSRPDLISKIKDRQQNFYCKLLTLKENEALVKKAMTYQCVHIMNNYPARIDKITYNVIKIKLKSLP